MFQGLKRAISDSIHRTNSRNVSNALLYANYLSLIHDHNKFSELKDLYREYIQDYFSENKTGYSGQPVHQDFDIVVNSLLEIASGKTDASITLSFPAELPEAIDVPQDSTYLCRANAIALLRVIVKETKNDWVPDLAHKIDRIVRDDDSNFVASSAAYLVCELQELGFGTSQNNKISSLKGAKNATSYYLIRRAFGKRF